jgi:Flp pilus assembly protein TadD
VQPLEPPDTHHFSSAQGWLELGNALEAKAELAHISSQQRKHPDVLELRWTIAAKEGDWQLALDVARTLVRVAPERPTGWLHQSYALRRAPGGGLKEAWTALLPTLEMFPAEPVIPYNLSCYACQMHDLDNARVWLKRAAAVGDKEYIRQLAMQDPDLEQLWPEIQEL